VRGVCPELSGGLDVARDAQAAGAISLRLGLPPSGSLARGVAAFGASLSQAKVRSPLHLSTGQIF